MLPMVMFPSILLSPTARVYTLRFLLIATLPTIYVSVKVVRAFGPLRVDPLYKSPYHKSIFALAIGIIIWVHHILATFQWTLRGLAVIHLTMVVIEMCGLLHFNLASIRSIESSLTAEVIALAITGWLPPVLAVILPPVLLLFFSLLFRITTVVKTHGRLVMQRFVFLGRCAPTHPPYSPASILLNRSLARPLVSLFKLILDEWEDLDDPLPGVSPARVNLDTHSDDSWLQQFRFTRAEVSTLVEALDLPDVVECPQSGIKEDRGTALCMLLPLPIPIIWLNWRCSLAGRLATPRFAQAFVAKGCPMKCIAAIIDGTLKKNARPSRNQRILFNGWKRIHCLKYHLLVSPDGIIIHIFGPVEAADTTSPCSEKVAWRIS
ncbi:hypothetical protein C8R45DRAFT_1171790 [Mycena sanguinolenta]|nr:hypothetical protein C8R45DRAFT_1171790 [Mycena sanguinolenta]